METRAFLKYFVDGCNCFGKILRITNTDWCLCGRWAAIETYTESFFCRETNEISDEYFGGDN